MPKIILTDVVKRWKDFYGTDHVSLDIPDKAFVTLLGPSGCGKTTILRMIAGLETPTSGRIQIGNEIVFDSEAGINILANKRNVGFLFQNYALWPNMTVYQNITFGLKNVKEELPLYDYVHKTRNDILKILEKPDLIIKLVNESKDKNQKIVVNRAIIKIVDEFFCSMMTAKEIFNLHLEEGQVEEKIEEKKQECLTKISELEASHSQKGEILDRDGKILVNGNPIRKVRKLEAEEIEQKLRHVARIVKVEEFMDRYPNELSGGQQQRVAIARTLAPGPKVLFMDEPLSNLDAKLRLEMRSELKRLHMETGATFVYVTHDQLEAMTLATHICLLNNGTLQQYDSPLTVYNHPNNLFVADFVGNPAITLIETKAIQNEDGTITLSLFNGKKAIYTPNGSLSLKEEEEKTDRILKEKEEKLESLKAMPGYVEKGNKDGVFNYHIAKTDMTIDRKDEKDPQKDEFVIGIRPEYFTISEEGEGLDGTVYSAMPSGMETTIKIDVDGFILTSVIFGSTDFKINEKIEIGTKGKNILLFDKRSERCIASGTLKFLK